VFLQTAALGRAGKKVGEEGAPLKVGNELCRVCHSYLLPHHCFMP
jgi:hypothetical protein